MLAVLTTIGAARTSGQEPSLRIEHRHHLSGGHAAGTVVDADAGGGITLAFRVVSASSVAQTAETHVDLPAGWQALFVGNRLEVPPQAALTDIVTIAAPRSAPAGDYVMRYEARPPPPGPAAAVSVTIRIRERRQLALQWLSASGYLRAGEAGVFDLLVTNAGNVPETVTLDVSSRLGSSLETTWRPDVMAVGETRRVRVVRPPNAVRHSTRDTLLAHARVDQPGAAAQATLGFEVVPEGRAPAPLRSRLPTVLALGIGTGPQRGFGSFAGRGVVDRRRSMTVEFGVLAREQSHPLTFERSRNFVNIRGPGIDFAFGDQTWALSYLTESGHHGFGAGGRLERGRWFGSAFVDTGRPGAAEARQVGGAVGLNSGRAATTSVQYLARFTAGSRSAPIGEMASVRLVLNPVNGLTADLEAGAGRSVRGTGQATSAEVLFNSRRLSLSAGRVRKDDIYPVRDSTGLIDRARLSVRPAGRLQFEWTRNATERVNDRALPLDAPVRQRVTRVVASWGTLARVSAGRTEWTSPGGNWTTQWQRESATAQLRLPLGAVWLAPGVERGTETTPLSPASPYLLTWLQAGLRMGRANTVNVRWEQRRGTGGDSDRRVRRLSFGATWRPVATTTLSVQAHRSASDALWLRDTRWITATFDQRLAWGHRLVFTGQRRSGATAFLRNDAAVQLNYVVPIGIPLRAAGDAGRITVRLHDGENGQPRARALVQIAGQRRLTDRDGVVAFTGLKPGNYHVTVAPDSLGPDRTVVPALPLLVSVEGGGQIEVRAKVVRTGRVTGRIQSFEPPSGGLSPWPAPPPVLIPARGVAGAIIELILDGEHRRATTDQDGRFAFDGVPPGEWRLRVISADVPAFYHLEETQVVVAVRPGQTRDLVLRAVPKLQSPAGGKVGR